MKHYCSTCINWQPVDESWEIGVCTEQPELSVVLRYRLRREEWQCWQADMGTKYIYPINVKPMDEPEPEPVQLDAKVVEAEVRHELSGQVQKAYWYVRKLARMAGAR